jgi:hypothetical protein
MPDCLNHARSEHDLSKKQFQTEFAIRSKLDEFQQKVTENQRQFEPLRMIAGQTRAPQTTS